MRQHPREREDLALPLRQVRGSLGQFRGIAGRQRFYEFVSVHRLRRQAHPLARDVRSHADVVLDRAREQEHILRHRLYGAPQAIQRKVADRRAVHADHALLDIPEAGDQVGDRGLARAGVADDGHHLARLYGEGQVLEHPLAFLVREPDRLELDMAPHRVGHGARRRVGNPVVRIQQGENALAACHRALQQGVLFRQILYRRIEHADQVHEGDQGAQRQRMPQEHRGADHQGHRRREGGQKVHRGPEQREHVHFAQVGLHEFQVLALELAGGGGFAREQLHHVHAGKALGDVGVHRAGPLPLPPEGVAGALAGDVRHQVHRRQGGQDRQRQAPVQREQDSQRADHHRKVLDEGGQHVGEELVDRFHVAGHARDQAPHRLPRKEGQRPSRRMPEQLHAQVLHHAQADLAGKIDHGEGRGQHRGQDAQEQAYKARDFCAVARAQGACGIAGQFPEIGEPQDGPTAVACQNCAAGSLQRRLLRGIGRIQPHQVALLRQENSFRLQVPALPVGQSRKARGAQVQPALNHRIRWPDPERPADIRTVRHSGIERIPRNDQRLVDGLPDDDGRGQLAQGADREGDQGQERYAEVGFHVSEDPADNGRIVAFGDLVLIEVVGHGVQAPCAQGSTMPDPSAAGTAVASSSCSRAISA